jgi:nicotinamidase-related amidase
MHTHPNLLSAGNSLLVVVDLQAKLTAAMAESEAQLMTINTGRLIKAAGLLHIPVLLTEQYPQGLGPTDPAIAELLPEGTPIFDKTGFSCCAAQGFNAALAATQRRQIILTGQETHVCVLQTALELLHFDYQVHTVEDAVASRKPVHKLTALQRMQQQGVTMTNHESVLFEWLRDASHPDFKTISGWLR